MDTKTRNADLQDLYRILQDQHARKIDVVAPATAITARRGNLVIAGMDAELTPEGVTTVDGTYRPNDMAIAGLAEKLNLPLLYVRKLHAQRPDLFDANVNGWLHGTPLELPSTDDYKNPFYAAPDARSFFVRGFTGDDGPGIARAVLSDTYGVMDHIDVLVAALDALRASGVEVQVGQCDLSDRRMYVKVHAPSIAAYAPSLLAGYTSPFSGNTGADNPKIFAGFVLQNSETGDGAWTIVPRITVEICSNGMTISKDALRKVHLGSKMDHGVIRWSVDTQRKNLELVKAQTTDAVRTFLDVGYVTRKVAELTEAAATPIEGNPEPVVRNVTKGLLYSEGQADDVLGMFIRGGQMTAGGVMQAVTAAAQVQTNADTAAAMESDAFKALELAAAGAARS